MIKTVTRTLLLFAMLAAGCCYAQKDKASKKMDTYKSFRSKSVEKEGAVLLSEADAIKYTNTPQALEKVKEALGISIAQGDVLTEAKCYILIGEINENIQEWKLALDNYLNSLGKLKSSYSSTTEYQSTIRGLGNVNLNLGNFKEALTFYKELSAMRLNTAAKTDVQLQLSEVYYQMGSYDEALAAVNSIPLKKLADPTTDALIENQRAKIYARTNDFDRTKNSYSNSISSQRANKVAELPTKSFKESKDDITEVLREQKRYDDEIDLRNQAIQLNLENKNISEVAKDKVEISKTLAAKGDNTAALKEIEGAVLLADTLKNPKAKADVYLALADQYERNGRSIQAISAYRRYSEAMGEVEKQNELKLFERSELIKQQRDIEELTKNVSIGQREETIEENLVVRQQLIIYGLLVILLISAVTSYFIYKNAAASKIANQLLALKSLRSQMNPHFIFNALNSVNHFIAQQDERTANKFLSEFSQLMRLVMENSQEDFIPLQKEQEILMLYLKLEHYRFRDKFEYSLTIDEDINTESLEVPPMLIQPYIENAVWHGLRYRETKGTLAVRFSKVGKNIIVEIKDDGIGRKKSAELKTTNQRKHNSMGLKNIEERLSIINKVYKSNYDVTIEDGENNTGTVVRITLPANVNQHRL